MHRESTHRRRAPGLALTSLLAAGLLCAGACSASGGSSTTAAPALTEERELPHFSRIEVSGPIEVQVEVGQPLAVSVHADGGTLQRLETEVQGDVLKVRLASRSVQPPEVRVGMPFLAALQAGGGSRVRVGGLQGGQIDLAVSGTSVLRASGSVLKLVARLDGAGALDLERLSVRDAADVHVRGAGEAVVTVSGALNATVEGDGAVLYRGNPIVFADTSGSGRVSPRR